MNITSTSRRKEVQENYSTLYKILDGAMAARLRELPVSAFVNTLVDDHTGTKFRFETACQYDGFANCLEVYTAIVEMTIFSGVAYISAADWVNLRDAMTLMMTKYWIGVPKDWGPIPDAVQRRFDAAVAKGYAQ